jgi:hypothetical protein
MEETKTGKPGKAEIPPLVLEESQIDLKQDLMWVINQIPNIMRDVRNSPNGRNINAASVIAENVLDRKDVQRIMGINPTVEMQALLLKLKQIGAFPQGTQIYPPN